MIPETWRERSLLQGHSASPRGGSEMSRVPKRRELVSPGKR